MPIEPDDDAGAATADGDDDDDDAGTGDNDGHWDGLAGLAKRERAHFPLSARGGRKD